MMNYVIYFESLILCVEILFFKHVFVVVSKFLAFAENRMAISEFQDKYRITGMNGSLGGPIAD